MSALAVGPPWVQEILLTPDESGCGEGECGVADVGAASGRPVSDGPGGEPSLDAVLSGLWEGLAAAREVACPVCGGDLRPVHGAHAHPVMGRCSRCGSELS